MTNLYRPEVNAHHQERLVGDVLLATPVPLRVIAGLLAATTSGAILFAALGSYASYETVGGRLAPTGGLISVITPATGSLESLGVEEGALLRPNQRIATLRLSQTTASGAVSDRMAAAVSEEEQAADAREHSQSARLANERSQLQTRIDGLKAEREQTTHRIANQDQQIALVQEDLERAEAVASKGFYPLAQVQQRRANLLTAQDFLSQLRGTLLSQTREIRDVEAQMGGLTAERASLAADSLAQRAMIAQRRVAADAQGAAILTAPIAGRVLTLPKQVGQALSGGAVVAVIAPSHSRLEAELFVPSRAAGFVRAGQEVRLKYAAFPFQRFGSASGQVRSVSRTVLPPSDAAEAGIRVDEPVFRVRVALKDQDIHAYGQAIPLQPGMLLQADIVTDRRSILAWLFDSIRAASKG
jgi:membrane fusion protein